MANETNVAYGKLFPVEQWIQLVFFYGFLCGLVSTFCSLAICVGIWRKKALRGRFYVIIAWLTLCRCGLCLQLLFLSVYRIARLCGKIDQYQDRVTCLFLHFWLYNGPTLELTLLCTLVIDRMIAILNVTYYRTMSEKSALHLCLGQYVLVSGIKLIPAFFGDPMNERVPCVDYSTFLNATYNTFLKATDIILVVVIMALYAVLIALVHRRGTSVEDIGDNSALKAYIRRQMELLPVLRNLVALHCSLATAGRIFLFTSAVVPKEHKQRMVLIGGEIVCVDIFVNCVWLLMSNEKIRTAALPGLFAKNSAVQVLRDKPDAPIDNVQPIQVLPGSDLPMWTKAKKQTCTSMKPLDQSARTPTEGDRKLTGAVL